MQTINFLQSKRRRTPALTYLVTCENPETEHFGRLVCNSQLEAYQAAALGAKQFPDRVWTVGYIEHDLASDPKELVIISTPAAIH